jgi:signal transduction histidine kinase/ActR/RegA family two-component response regulator
MSRAVDREDTAALSEAFHQIMGESPDGILLYRAEEEGARVGFRRVFLNRSAVRMLGVAYEDLIGNRVDDQSVGPFAKDGMSILGTIHRSGEPVERQIEIGRGAEFRAFRVRGRPTGEFIGVRLIDVTERVVSERAIQRREAILHGVAEAGHALLHRPWSEVLEDVVAALGESTDVRRLYVSRVRPDPEGDTEPEMLAEWWNPRPEREIDPHEGASIPGTPTRIRLPIELRGVPWGIMGFDDGGESRAWSRGEMEALGSACALLGAAIDRELREKETADQLWQAQKLDTVGRLAGGIAHDFNNLLTVIRGNVELAQHTDSGEPRALPELDEVARAAERGARLTQQLLAFSRRQVLLPTAFDLNEAVRDLSDLFRPLIGDHIEVELDLDPGLGEVLADPSQMEQALMNLVLNARDAMSEGGRLVVGTANVELDEAFARKHLAAPPGSYVRLSVSDEGEGIDPAFLDRIFDPFFTTKPHGEGTGLGLSTVYGVVKQSRGAIFVYSEPGEGTTFKIYLPRATEGATPACDGVGRGSAAGHVAAISHHDGESKELSPAGGLPETILIVDNDPTVLSLATRILGRLGYAIETAGSLDEAIRRLGDGRRPDLLLADMVLPGTTGRALARDARSRWPGLPVVFMSGFAEKVAVNRGALESGCHFVEKPFTSFGLGRAIRTALDSAPIPQQPSRTERSAASESPAQRRPE